MQLRAHLTWQAPSYYNSISIVYFLLSWFNFLTITRLRSCLNMNLRITQPGLFNKAKIEARILHLFLLSAAKELNCKRFQFQWQTVQFKFFPRSYSIPMIYKCYEDSHWDAN